MKVLDLFCGRGGWSRPFVEDGDEVDGVDIVDTGVYPGNLILQDIRTFHPTKEYDFVIGSSPCIEFSLAKMNYKWHPEGQDIQGGLSLVKEFGRVWQESKAPLWALENVSTLAWWFPMNPIWHFKIGSKARRCLWGNIPISLRTREEWTEERRNLRSLFSGKNPDKTAEIPYPIARFIANTVKGGVRG
jgi:site-specific DNA-cytosine methylase